jgi:hypothetical protein
MEIVELGTPLLYRHQRIGDEDIFLVSVSGDCDGSHAPDVVICPREGNAERLLARPRYDAVMWWSDDSGAVPFADAPADRVHRFERAVAAAELRAARSKSYTSG